MWRYRNLLYRLFMGPVVYTYEQIILYCAINVTYENCIKFYCVFYASTFINTYL